MTIRRSHLCIAIALLGAVALWWITTLTHFHIPCKDARTFSLLNEYTLCKETPSAKEYAKLRTKLFAAVSQMEGTPSVGLISVHFLDLVTNQSVGISETEKYAPASLVKLPVVISIYRMAENDPSILTRVVTPSASEITDEKDQNFAPKAILRAGIPYTFEELIAHMIRYSSNDALNLILRNLTSEELAFIDQTMFDLGLIRPDYTSPDPGNDRVLSTRLTTNMLRTIYTGTYILPEYSNELLELMTEASFDAGIERGVPSSISVAHKFGERSGINDLKWPLNLHDCGIVYFPDHPYILCVMTRGNDFAKMAEAIGMLSSITYSFVEEQNQ